MGSEHETRVHLCLCERTEEVVDRNGIMHSIDRPEISFRSGAIIRELEASLGDSETRLPGHERANYGHAFGGHDVLASISEVLFVLASAGVISGIFSLLKEWVALKKDRRVSLEIATKEGEKISIDISGQNIEEVTKVISRYL